MTIPDKTLFDDDISDHLEDTARISVQRPVLTMLDGGEVNHRYSIEKRRMIVGRDIACDLVLSDTRCSRRHMAIEFTNIENCNEEPRIVVEDLGSTNGIFLNGQRLVGRQVLKDRDKILAGTTLFGFSLRDATEVQADQRLLELATLDALTGLANRGMFNREIIKEFDRARRYKRELSLVMFDIDHFKRFNDTYGHQMGDRVLQEMGRLVRLNQRSNDVCGRYGGEEFAIILPETAIKGALIYAERLRESVERNSFDRDGTCCRVTISVGVATQEPDINSYEELIRLTDKALYRAKASGRNCLCWTQHGEYIVGAPSNTAA